MINIQPIEKLSLGDGNSLSVHSIFYTIQGEGPYSGYPALFIRLAGCNLQCSGCDTEYTEGRQIMPVKSILNEVFDHCLRRSTQFKMFKPLVVITGGEPFRQNITKLVVALQHTGFRVQIETNGTLPPSPDFPKSAMVICSPKSPKLNKELGERADFFKYVLSWDSVDETDGLPINVLGDYDKQRVARPPSTYLKAIFLQPMDPGWVTINSDGWQEHQRNIAAVVESCKKFGHVVQLQVHKILGVA